MKELIYVCILIGLVFATKQLLQVVKVKRKRYCSKCNIEVGDDIEICQNCGQGYYITILNPDGTTIQSSAFVGEKSSSIVIILSMIGFAVLLWFVMFKIY